MGRCLVSALLDVLLHSISKFCQEAGEYYSTRRLSLADSIRQSAGHSR